MKVERRQILCVLLGIILAAAVYFVDSRASPLMSGGRLLRNSYGQGERMQTVSVEGLWEEALWMDISVRERQYGEAEAQDAMDRAAAEIESVLKTQYGNEKEAEGWELCVREGSQMELPAWLESYGIAVEWIPENTDYMGTDGMVYEAGCPKEGRELSLTACLTAGAYSKEYEFTVRIYPKNTDSREGAAQAFQNYLEEVDEGQQKGEYLTLPEEYDGRKLSYRVKRSRDFLVFPILGIAAAMLLPLNDRQKEKKRKQVREQQMMFDYPEIVSKLVVFSGAGLPVRKAWERIVLDYEKTGETREAYEEMAAAYHMMQRGVPELRAYSEFGKRCRLIPYRKLAGLLEQNIKNGSEGLRKALEAEMEAAFEQKKNLARKMGEEASTKLLLPLFLMLFIVMAMVSVPAFLSFGIG